MFTYRFQMKGSSYRWDSRAFSDTCVSGGQASSLSRSGVSHPCPQCDLGFFSKTPCLGWLSFVSLFLVGFFFSISCSTVYVLCTSWLFAISTASFHLLPPTVWKWFCPTHFVCFLILKWLVYYWPSCMCRFVHWENRLVKGIMQYAINKYSLSEIIYSWGN